MLEIVFSSHARFQVNERGISEDLVRKALTSPQVSFLQSDGRMRSVRKFSRKKKPYVIVVISEDTKLSKKVITTFITSKVTKYFQKP